MQNQLGFCLLGSKILIPRLRHVNYHTHYNLWFCFIWSYLLFPNTQTFCRLYYCNNVWIQRCLYKTLTYKVQWPKLLITDNQRLQISLFILDIQTCSCSQLQVLLLLCNTTKWFIIDVLLFLENLKLLDYFLDLIFILRNLFLLYSSLLQSIHIYNQNWKTSCNLFFFIIIISYVYALFPSRNIWTDSYLRNNAK